MRSFVNIIIPRVSNRPLYCEFLEVAFEKQKMLKIFINVFLPNQVCLEGKNHNAFINNASTSVYKNPNFFGKSQEEHLTLVPCPFNSPSRWNCKRKTGRGLKCTKIFASYTFVVTEFHAYLWTRSWRWKGDYPHRYTFFFTWVEGTR